MCSNNYFFKFISFAFFACIISNLTIGQNQLPYPVIFVHGLADKDECFLITMKYLRDHDNLGDINIYDVTLNADNDTETSLLSDDVKWENFEYNGHLIHLGRRNYAADRDDYIFEWSGSNIFAINFQEERISGAAGLFNDYFDNSNQSAIFKQGYALNKMINEVLTYTGAEKVILVGHSMGGLCIREYLQRTNEENVHINWIDPNSPDGHKVARVVTIGTPHLGSNASLDPTKTDIPDPTGNTEANRDLLFSYNHYTHCEADIYQGIYMFGGNENCIASEGGLFGNKTFDNVDINCNGNQTDDIIGINESFNSYSFNPEMPLPDNIKYTYITSIWAGWVGDIGDGAVAINRQWLHNEDNIPVPLGITDTCLTRVFHTSEGGDYFSILRGMDEPADFNFAYGIFFNNPVIGYITYQQNMISQDEDVYKINASGFQTIGININNNNSGIDSISVFNTSLIKMQTFVNFSNSDTLQINVLGNDFIYIKIYGTATFETWQNPYTLKAIPLTITQLKENQNSQISVYPNPSNGMLYFSNIENYNNLNVTILNIMGEIILIKNDLNSNYLNLDKLQNGTYFIKFETDEFLELKRINIVR